jgi:hypothetical protein
MHRTTPSARKRIGWLSLDPWNDRVIDLCCCG